MDCHASPDKEGSNEQDPLTTIDAVRKLGGGCGSLADLATATGHTAKRAAAAAAPAQQRGSESSVLGPTAKVWISLQPSGAPLMIATPAHPACAASCSNRSSAASLVSSRPTISG